MKYIWRVCLTNKDGERLLDTLVGEQFFPENTVVAQPKEGVRKQMQHLAQDIGPSLADIKAIIVHFCKGKKLIGYHMPLKL